MLFLASRISVRIHTYKLRTTAAMRCVPALVLGVVLRSVLGSSQISSASVETRLASAGCTGSLEHGAVTPPIHLSTTYERDENAQLGEFDYIRYSSPTRRLFEEAFADLEGGTQSFGFSSGMAAASALLLSDPSAHVIFPDDMYMASALVVQELMPWLTHERVDMTNHTALEASLRATAKSQRNVLLWLETPSNPQLKITDIQAAATLAKSILGTSVCVACDATWSTPYLLKPLDLGCDVVWHSCTKYIGGHSDALGGVVTVGNTSASLRIAPKLSLAYKLCGGVLAPLESYLLLRGMRTLHLRMDRHCANAMAVARFLSKCKSVDEVLYPGLPTHAQHRTAKRQQIAGRGFGGMLSVRVRHASDSDGTEEALRVVKRVRVFRRATSLGGTESLIEHRRSVDGCSPPDLLRISVGLENIDDLIADLKQALAQ